MELSQAANYFNTEKFSIYNRTTETWEVGSLIGKLAPIDRFLSNFSRPLHRRMFICEPSTVIPESFTIRSDTTGEIYIIGQGRYDSYAGNLYQALYLAHLVSGDAGGIGVVSRKLPAGPANDPGHLVPTEVGKYYIDVELRATTSESGTEQQQAGQYFLLAPPEANLAEWDFVTLNGKTYKVEEEYFDSGLKFSRVLQTEDNRVDIIYLKTTAFDYDTTLGQPQDISKPYDITATIHEYTKISTDSNTVGENKFKVVIADSAIGFEPTPREAIVLDGTTHIILEVARDPLTTEWVLLCQA